MFKKFFKRNKKEEVKEEIPEVAISQEETNEGEEEIATEEVDNAKEETALDASLETEEKEEEEETIEEESNEEVKEEQLTEERVEEPKEAKVSLFERLKQGLSKAKQGITDRVDQVLKSYTKVDDELIEEIEEILITADVGVETTMDIIDKLTDAIKTKKITDPQDVKGELKLIIEEILTNDNSTLDVRHSPSIIVMVGVNGVGKTTTIGKLAARYKKEGKKVLIAAGDTFRAAAIDQ